MTAKDLIAMLQNLDGDLPVVFNRSEDFAPENNEEVSWAAEIPGADYTDEEYDYNKNKKVIVLSS